jgi:hypothetical protein
MKFRESIARAKIITVWIWKEWNNYGPKAIANNNYEGDLCFNNYKGILAFR